MAKPTLVPLVVKALNLPPSGQVDRRIPKTVLSEHGASTAGQRKLIDTAVERLDWLVSLSPTTVGIAAEPDGDKPVTEVQLLSLAARTEATQALLTIIHRAIPYPIILVTQSPSGVVRLSLAPLRRAERLHDRMVIEQLAIAPGLSLPLDEAAHEFLSSLDLSGLPRTDLGTLYEGLAHRLDAFSAARLSGKDFRLPRSSAEAEARREGLSRYAHLESEWASACAASRKEKRLAIQVALAEQARILKNELKMLAERLA